MSSVVKLGTWGGDGGSACDITVAPQRLESITIRWGKFVIDCIAFSYRDRRGKLHTAGPWGGDDDGKGEEGTETTTITLEPSEYVTGVDWSVGPFESFELKTKVERCITSIKVVTNLRSYGPFGQHGVDSTQHTLPVLGNGSVVGMFARAGDFLEAIGFYVLPAAVTLFPAVKPTAAEPPTAREQEEKEKESVVQEEEKEKEKSSNQDEQENKESSQEEKENGNPNQM